MAKRLAQSPAYLMYPSDILSSGRVAALKPLEELWYRRALDLGWEHDGMPADATEFAGWVGRGCTVVGAEKIIAKFYEPHKRDADKVVNQRQEKERTNLRKSRQKKSEGGRKGMENRWKRDKQTTSDDNIVITKNIASNNISIPIPIPISLSNKKQSGDDFIHDLKTNPDYSHIQVDIELSRAEAWARDKGRQFTRRFVTAWFDRVEAPLKISTNGNGSKPPPQWKIDQDACEACDENGYVLNLIPHKVCKHQ